MTESFAPGTRVAYAADGRNKALRGKHGTVHRTLAPLGELALDRTVAVRFDGHSATWYVPARRLTRVED